MQGIIDTSAPTPLVEKTQGGIKRLHSIVSDFTIHVRDLRKELEELHETGAISSEERRWLEECFRVFGLLPEDLLGWKNKSITERVKVLAKCKVSMTAVSEKWSLPVEGEEMRKKLPASLVAEYIAEEAVRLGLVSPVYVWLGRSSELALIAGRRLHFSEDVTTVAYALSGAAMPEYSSQQLFPPLKTALSRIATRRTLTRKEVNPEQYLNLANVVVDLETLTPVEEVEAVFTYELPAVEPSFIDRVRKGEVSEEYFKTAPFYAVIRKHYSDKEWEKLKGALGALLAPFSLKLIAIIKGETDTRKTFLYNLMRQSLGELVAPIRLQQLFENRFALQHALGARALIASEEAQTIVHNIELLKSLSGGDPVVIDRKHKEAVVRDYNPLKIYIFSNSLPLFKRYDDALVGRLLIVETENPQPPTPEERQLMSRAAGKDFVEFLLWCYWELRSRDWRIPEHGSEDYARALLEGQSNVYRFVEELEQGELDLGTLKVITFFGKGYKTPGAEAYDIYCEWCRLRGEKPEGRNTFYQLFEHTLRDKGVVKTRERDARYFTGIALIAKSKDAPEVPFT